MQQQPPNVFQNPEVVKRLLVTLGCVTVYIIGRNIPVPGPPLGSLPIFGHGVAPYLGAMVLLSLLRATGRVETLAGKDAAGRNGIYRVARPLALLFAVGQALPLAAGIDRTPAFIIPVVVTLAAGAMLVLWLAEEITENGIGNGVLLILFVDIAAQVPDTIGALSALVRNEDLALSAVLGIGALVLFALFAAVNLETAQRKIPVQYAKRVVGRMMMGGQQTTVPVKVNPAGALALIAAATAAAWPAALFAGARHPAVYFPLFVALVIFFSWLYRTSGVEPRELAGQIQQNGGFILGTRGGDAMSGYFSRLIDRLSLSSAFPVVVVVVVPAIALRMIGSPAAFGEVSIYLMAAVVLDSIGQIQARAMMQNLGGSLPKPGKMKSGGRRMHSSKRRKKRR